MENVQLESLSPISLHYKTGPLCQNEGAILKIKGRFCPWPLPKLSLLRTKVLIEPHNERNNNRFLLGENKGTDQLRSNCEADYPFVFTTWIVLFPYFLNPKFPTSSHLP